MAAPMPELTQQTTAKLVLLGEMGSGKSSLVLRYVKGQFFDYQVGDQDMAAILRRNRSRPQVDLVGMLLMSCCITHTCRHPQLVQLF